MTTNANRSMLGYCTRCKNPGRDKCTELCPIAAEYVSKGYVGQAEYLPQIALDHWAGVLNPMPNRDMSKLSTETRKILILLLYNDGKDTHDIARHVECSQQYAHEVVSNWKLLVRKTSKYAPKYQISHI